MSTAKKLKPRVMKCSELLFRESPSVECYDESFSANIKLCVLVLPLDDVPALVEKAARALQENWGDSWDRNIPEKHRNIVRDDAHAVLWSLGLPVVPKAKKGRT